MSIPVRYNISLDGNSHAAVFEVSEEATHRYKSQNTRPRDEGYSSYDEAGRFGGYFDCEFCGVSFKKVGEYCGRRSTIKIQEWKRIKGD